VARISTTKRARNSTRRASRTSTALRVRQLLSASPLAQAVLRPTTTAVAVVAVPLAVVVVADRAAVRLNS
jgi:hypothetical protein